MTRFACVLVLAGVLRENACQLVESVVQESTETRAG
jgi:hypothetical protein